MHLANPHGLTEAIGRGFYGFGDAALLSGLNVARIREWFRGHRGRPVFSSDYRPAGKDFAISFLDLIDVFVAGQLRQAGVPLQILRQVYARLGRQLDTKHPFCRRELLCDGRDVFTRTLDGGEDVLTHVITNQRVFPDVILPFLRSIDYEEVTKLARRWHIADKVVVDPEFCFGRPCVAEVGIPTAILSAAYHANGKDAELVANWYGVHAGHVVAAAKFESKLAA